MLDFVALIEARRHTERSLEAERRAAQRPAESPMPVSARPQGRAGNLLVRPWRRVIALHHR
jgi:hypothetical protein